MIVILGTDAHNQSPAATCQLRKTIVNSYFANWCRRDGHRPQQKVVKTSVLCLWLSSQRLPDSAYCQKRDLLTNKFKRSLHFWLGINMIICTHHNSSYHKTLGLLCFQHLPSNNHFRSGEIPGVSPRKTLNHPSRKDSILSTDLKSEPHEVHRATFCYCYCYYSYYNIMGDKLLLNFGARFQR